MGSPDPKPEEDIERWWVMRTMCNDSSCAAIGLQLDPEDHSRLKEQGVSVQLQFTEGNWNETPRQNRQDVDECSIGANGTMQQGQDTTSTAWQLRPESNGSFHGAATETVVTGECNRQGTVYQTPFTAERIGDTPPAIAVPAPRIGEEPLVPEAVPGPALAGLYQLSFDTGKTRSDGTFGHGDDVELKWWAYRSRCTASGCVATGAKLDEENPTQAAGRAGVLRFVDGRWDQMPRPARVPCAYDKTSEHTVEDTLTLEPLPDGSLRGTYRYTIISNECGGSGSWFEVPITAVRTGEIPTTVNVADPALFG